MTSPTEPVATVHLFAPLHAELMGTLDGLSETEWEAPTICSSWRVRDVAAHLLDTQLRRLSMGRDKLTPPAPAKPLASYEALVEYLDQLNAEWVRTARRLSPRVIRDLLAWVGPQIAEHFAALPPEGEAVFPVAWAAKASSANWMDIGREYTEQWLHQQHIRLAVGHPTLRQRRWLHPVLALFARAIPRAYAGVEAEEGTTVVLEISGDAHQHWTLRRRPNGWTLESGAVENPFAHLTMSDDDAWRLFSKSLRDRAPHDVVQVVGDPRLAEPLFAARAIMG